MSHSVTLLCRIDSLSDKNHIDGKVSSVLKGFRNHFRGRKSQLTPDSQLERKFVFHRLTPVDANRLISTCKIHAVDICMKSVSARPALSSAPTPPTSPVSSALSPNFSAPRDKTPPKKPRAESDDSPSSSTRRLVLNFGLDASTDSVDRGSGGAGGGAGGVVAGGGSTGGPSPSSSKSFFSSRSDSTAGSGVGVGTLVATPEVLLLRELAEIMKVLSIGGTPSKIGKEVSRWFVTDRVQSIMRRIV
ncbi:unnamed protein product [Ectocarpus sp. 12 AP-2014]